MQLNHTSSKSAQRHTPVWTSSIVEASGNVQLFDHLVCRGANPHLSIALHRASKCPNHIKSIAMIDDLLDEHRMDINANDEDLRDSFDHSYDSGTPLNCAT